MTLDWLDEAKQDLLEAAIYYQLQEFGLGESFAGRVESAVKKILKDPERYREFDSPCRKVVTDGFPYQIVYVVQDKSVLIVAVMHQHREPGYWRVRIES